jgi:hypothetical protein
MTTATLSLPPVTPDFQRIVRALGCELGWKNVAKMIAFGPTAPMHPAVQTEHYEPPKATRTRNTFGHKDNYLGLPGPNPPRNKAGGFKVVGLGAYKTGCCRNVTGWNAEGYPDVVKTGDKAIVIDYNVFKQGRYDPSLADSPAGK